MYLVFLLGGGQIDPPPEQRPPRCSLSTGKGPLTLVIANNFCQCFLQKRTTHARYDGWLAIERQKLGQNSSKFRFHGHSFFPRLHSEYRAFRTDAIAFDKDLIDPSKDGRSRYEHVNRSMLHFDRKGRGYYAGDIKNGPFACWRPGLALHRRSGSVPFGGLTSSSSRHRTVSF